MGSQTKDFLQELSGKVRPVTKDDHLLMISYSKLDLFDKCNRRYKLKYIDGQFAKTTSIANEIGSILHKGLELKGSAKIRGDSEIDYDGIKKVVYEGCTDGKKTLLGINDIKKKYFQEWAAKDEASGLSYEDKMKTYINDVLPDRMEDDWTVVGVEIPFEFVYDDKVIIHGFIDRVDERTTDGVKEIRITDYKSSRKIFDDSKIKTPLQMITYDLACLYLYNILPAYHEYDFIMLNQKQTTDDGVCSKGYLKRGIKKLDNLIARIERCEKDNLFPPYPTPLCYWCEFASKAHTPNADAKYGDNCQYYSLWTPENKVFQVNKKFVIGEEEKPVRKLVF